MYVGFHKLVLPNNSYFTNNKLTFSFTTQKPTPSLNFQLNTIEIKQLK